jgi:hypothetical protein
MAEVEEVLGQRAHDRERNVNFTAVSRGDSRVGAGGLSRHDRGPGSTPRGLGKQMYFCDSIFLTSIISTRTAPGSLP